MSVGSFLDKQLPPTESDLHVALGPSLPLWREALEFLEHTYRPKQELRFYGKSYGWAVRFHRASRNLLALYPRRDGFTVQIILPPSLIDAALASDLSPETRAVIERATPYPEGRWLFLPVQTRDALDEIKRLVLLKARPARPRP